MEHERESNNTWDGVYYTNTTTEKNIVVTCYRLDNIQMLALFGTCSELDNKETVYINGIAGDCYAGSSNPPTNNLIWGDEIFYCADNYRQ